MATDPEKREENARKLDSSRQLASQALSLGFTVVIFVIIGVVLDNVFKTAPLFILIGVFFALASMVYFFVKLIRSS